ncbi:hypothetical protein BH24ACT2_BH24ACT2_08410 [soil metagenome]|nr:DUF3499 family protein [Acidimicrobiia bacterium]MBA3955805.1 DUF3499 family protein [Acidimicrobiia bacterium]MDQ3463088.1 DUF3499 family protein [Actinomycetota bacterium]
MGSFHATLGTRRPAPAIRPRLCARPACAEVACATMTYDYAARAAWIDRLDDDASPAGYDLCDGHATRLGVPSGWTRTDRRDPASVFDRVAV